MKRLLKGLSLAAVVLVAASGSAGAEEASLAPVRAVVLPAVEGNDTTKVAFLFDLGGLRAGEGRRIDEALFVWEVPSIPAEATAEFAVREITQSWDLGAVRTGEGQLRTATEDADLWEVGPRDLAKTGRHLVRFALQPAVEAWASEARANYGIVLATPDLTPRQLEAYLGSARLLLWYGFMK